MTVVTTAAVLATVIHRAAANKVAKEIGVARAAFQFAFEKIAAATTDVTTDMEFVSISVKNVGVKTIRVATAVFQGVVHGFHSAEDCHGRSSV